MHSGNQSSKQDYTAVQKRVMNRVCLGYPARMAATGGRTTSIQPCPRTTHHSPQSTYLAWNYHKRMGPVRVEIGNRKYLCAYRVLRNKR